MKVFVAAWIGSPNVGDELLFAALRRKLEARGAAVTAVSVDPDATRRDHGVTAVSGGNVPAILSAIRAADALVLGGGGLLQDETSHLNLPYHLSRVWGARLTRTPFVGVGLGAGALRTGAARWLVRRALGGARGVSVRDAESASLLGSLGVPRVVTAADLAFSLPVEPVEPAERIAVCLRSWPQRSRALPMSLRWRRDLGEDRLFDLLAARLDEAAESTGLAVRFVAFHRGRDDVLHRRVAERMRTPTSCVEPAPGEIAGEIGRARAAVSMRYHGGVLAAAHGRPVVLVGDSAKVGSLAGELGPGGALVARDEPSLASLPEALARVLPAEAPVREAAARMRERERGNDRVLDLLVG